MTIPIADAHLHSNPHRGLGAGVVAARFKRAGGWFAALVSLSPWTYGIEFRGLDSYIKTYEFHLRECRVFREAGLKVACIAGMHPADVDKLVDRYRLKPHEVIRLGKEVVRELSRLCREGRIDGIGEVGRQHYRTMPERVMVASMIMREAVEAAMDNGCVVHLHLEQAGESTVEAVEWTLRDLNISGAKSRIVFHHASPRVAVEAHRAGYSVNVPGVPRLLEYVVSNLGPFYMVESDYIDDKSRPGVVIYPWEMAEVVKRLAARVGEEYIYKVNVDNVVRVYGVDPP